MGMLMCAEPIINGESLVDCLKRAERKPIGYAGLSPQRLSDALVRLRSEDVQILGCTCGDSKCAWAIVHVKVGSDEVVWDRVRASCAEVDVYAGIGPYRFARDAYEKALAAPRRLNAPIRDRSGLERLASGIPADHRMWLEQLYVETGEGPGSDENMGIARAGLGVFLAAGEPMSDATAASWARNVGFLENNVETVVSFVRAVRERR